MVDDSMEIPERNFTRPSDSPRNTHYYNLPILTDEQQAKLNNLKHKINIEDEEYLAAHPEVRACIAIGIRNILQIRPRKNVLETFAKYFAKPKIDLEDEIASYLQGREVLGHPDTTHVHVQKKSTIKNYRKESMSRRLSETTHVSFQKKTSILYDVKELLSELMDDVTHVYHSDENLGDLIKDIIGDFKQKSCSKMRILSDGNIDDKKIVTDILNSIIMRITNEIK